MTTPEERDAIDAEQGWADRRLLDQIDRADAAHAALTEAQATIAELEQRIAKYQTWLSEASAENIELRRRLDMKAR